MYFICLKPCLVLYLKIESFLSSCFFKKINIILVSILNIYVIKSLLVKDVLLKQHDISKIFPSSWN